MAGGNVYRIVLACDGIPAQKGEAGALAIEDEFKQRHWHHNVTCTWNGYQLLLQADNDFDPKGLALLDEFSDAISACIPGEFDSDLKILHVTKL